MARDGAAEKAACGKAILAAFEVDPLLAAEMIYRGTDEVWKSVAATMREHLGHWHAQGKVDRALRFMMNSGRAEFVDVIWPLITHENEQISLKALRNCRRFRTSVLGEGAEKRIKGLPSRQRQVLLSEIAHHSGMDGLELVTAIARDDPDPEVQASVIDSLAFRRADRHVTELLKHAGDTTIDLVARKGLVEKVGDEGVKQRLSAANERVARSGPSETHRLREILDTDGNNGAEVAAIIGEMKFETREDAAVYLIYEARRRYPQAVADGLLTRVLTNQSLFYGVDDILASTGFRHDNEALLELALAESPRNDVRAQSAASVFGADTAGRLIDALLDLGKRLTDEKGNRDQAAIDRYHLIEKRIAHVPGASLVAAVQSRSAQADNEQMAQLADLLHRWPDDSSERARPFDSEALIAIRGLAEDWGNRMLASGSAKRSQLLTVASLAEYAPDVSLLPLLKRLLDENLSRYRAFYMQVRAPGGREGTTLQEVQWPMMAEYQRAFLGIKAPETAALMREYLSDVHFGEYAAGVLASHWIAANEPPPERGFFSGIDFSLVQEKRAARKINPNATSPEADAIFAAIEPLIADGASEDQEKLAAALGIIAVRLPHGQRQGAIEKLLSIIPRNSRSKFLLNLILSGKIVESELVIEGIDETLLVAKKEWWILNKSDGYELRQWLQLLPFTNRPADALQVWRNIPDADRRPRLLEEVFDGLAKSPSEGTEDVFFKLAEDDPRFYEDRRWLAAARTLGTVSAARRLIDLMANGTLQGKEANDWLSTRELGTLIEKFPEVRRHVYGLLKDGADSGPLVPLARAVLENPDAEGLLLLVDFENRHKRWVVGWSAIEKVVTEHVPDKNWNNAYNIVPVPTTDLRRNLLARVTDGCPTDAAARCLNIIDTIRDEYGVPSSEPRHPDIERGKPWPIMTGLSE